MGFWGETKTMGISTTMKSIGKSNGKVKKWQTHSYLPCQLIYMDSVVNNKPGAKENTQSFIFGMNRIYRIKTKSFSGKTQSF
jgi:hypothetical protein